MACGEFAEVTMGTIELILVALGLSMDAFSVALCKGLKMRKFHPGHAAVIALFFGGFQAFMPLGGYFLGRQFEKYIVRFDHWIAFGLLLIIGAKMIYDAIKHCEEIDGFEEELNIKELFLMAVATSIDALAVGVTMSFLKVNIALAVSLIGGVTFALCYLGVAIGNKFGGRFKKKAEIAGGAILILIGLKILLEHLGIINF